METQPRSVRSYLRDGMIVVILAFALIYLGTFLYLSRSGMHTAEEYGWDFYYFTEPTWTAEREQTGETLCMVYWPLIEIDARLVSGMHARAVRPVQLIEDIQSAPSVTPLEIRRSPIPVRPQD
ncbi:hypothetical protein LOC68_17080 [Blastopirellula sp. JC732]|uniref:Uncharacterized protein n=1 Tax=Blastopirellula sediminis TaxID=2894196 RepID=A0A9X1MR62_9BACT|nr:hypothetical protein [Blastopirellula sediminis]MCC9606593.1 hypothetical protein [Blastopirellula sediminis]MCC9630109.1 hypothetical protein [Blastopirellula sediminis]